MKKVSLCVVTTGPVLNAHLSVMRDAGIPFIVSYTKRSRPWVGSKRFNAKMVVGHNTMFVRADDEILARVILSGIVVDECEICRAFDE